MVYKREREMTNSREIMTNIFLPYSLLGETQRELIVSLYINE